MHDRRRTSGFALLLLAGLAGCGEEHHYAVDLDGNARPVDEDGKPLAGAETVATGQPAPTGSQMPGTTLQAVVTLDPALGVDPSAFDCVFVMARQDDNAMASLVQKVDHPAFPLTVTLQPDGTHGTELTGTYVLHARLDSDGDALPQAGDVQGVAQALATGGGPPVAIELNQRLTSPLDATTGAAPDTPGPGAETGAPAASEAAEARFTGTVELAPEFAELNGKHTLFVILRSATGGGMPLAPQKFEHATFPLDFDIGAESFALDVDNKQEILQGQLKIYARLSLTGNPMGQPGDIESEPVVRTAAEGPILLTLSKQKQP